MKKNKIILLAGLFVFGIIFFIVPPETFAASAATGNNVDFELPTIDITNTNNNLTAPGNTGTSNQSGLPSGQTNYSLLKDSNNDGVSDYDSVFTYKLDPYKPSPTSNYSGSVINAGEKILLGYDPTQTKLVKIKMQRPEDSSAPIVLFLNVKEISLGEDGSILFKGQALPNSFVTLYIYSTPIMVTVKANSSGEWQYVLNKELPKGDHLIYVATVNNEGNITAKSSGYLFTKTADAVTLKGIPIVESSVDANKPGFLEGDSFYLFLAIVVLVVIAALILIGITSRRIKN